MSTSNEHAARLRDMADAKKSQASVWNAQSTYPSPGSEFTQRQCDEESLRCEREAAALLAGAEALERQERDLDAIKAADAALTEAMETISNLRGSLEVAKAALETIRDRCRSAGQGAAYGELKNIREYVPDDMRRCDDVATAALARLERK
jgi:hypothetical protein